MARSSPIPCSAAPGGLSTPNCHRAWFLREHIRGRVLLPFALPLLPAAALGVFLLGRLPPAVGRVLIGAFVLSATLRPVSGQASAKKRIPPERLLPVGGALIGFFSTLVGATGPLLGPFIVALELSPQGTVGTMAACQVFQHASKVLVFGFAGFDFQRQIWPALGLSMCAIAGSALGTRWLDRVDRNLFKRAVKVVLILLSLQLLISGLWELFASSDAVTQAEIAAI